MKERDINIRAFTRAPKHIDGITEKNNRLAFRFESYFEPLGNPIKSYLIKKIMLPLLAKQALKNFESKLMNNISYKVRIMKKIVLSIAGIVLLTCVVNAQNLNSTNGGFEKKRIIDGKKFRVMYYEYEINKTVDEVWAEVAGNFVNVGEIAKPINESHCESGDVTEGLGAARYCSIDFAGKEVEIKERITEYRECGDHREFTYDVYETKGFPAKVYNTWIVRKGEDGKTYLGNVFIFRANFAPMTGMMGRQLKKLKGLRNSVLAYKHYLETGEKKADPGKFDSLYPEV